MQTTEQLYFLTRIPQCYEAETGEPFPLEARETTDAATRYDGAPLGLLAHSAAADPLFTFANDTALRAFGYTREELIGMPSRLSAAAGADLEERNRLFQALETHGHYFPYRGRRRRADGSAFWILDATIWNVTDDDGRRIGQATLIRGFAADETAEGRPGEAS
jgi:PAS domain S-box-containing protein